VARLGQGRWSSFYSALHAYYSVGSPAFKINQKVQEPGIPFTREFI